MYLLTSAILSATAKRINFVFPNKFCLCNGPKEPTLSELCRRDLRVPAHGTSDLTSPSDGHKKRKKTKTYLFNMCRNPLTKQVFVFVCLTFELRYLSLHCLEISLLESNSMALSFFHTFIW